MKACVHYYNVVSVEASSPNQNLDEETRRLIARPVTASHTVDRRLDCILRLCHVLHGLNVHILRNRKSEHMGRLRGWGVASALQYSEGHVW